jgi:hypothetical protein
MMDRRGYVTSRGVWRHECNKTAYRKIVVSGPTYWLKDPAQANGPLIIIANPRRSSSAPLRWDHPYEA